MDKIKKTLVKGKIVKCENIATNIFLQEIFIGDICENIIPMQFCSIYTGKGEMILPRPISIFDVDTSKKTMSIVFYTFGKGTTHLSMLKVNDSLDILLPLGNGFSDFHGISKIALVGGGIGIPPLYFLKKEIQKANPSAVIDVYLGYRDEPFLQEYFNDVNVYISSDNNENYYKGNVVSLLSKSNKPYDKIVSCGPTIMLDNLSKYAHEKDVECYVSLEERMGCSIGACYGCTVKVKTECGYENKKVCVDGPVFNSKEVF